MLRVLNRNLFYWLHRLWEHPVHTSCNFSAWTTCPPTTQVTDQIHSGCALAMTIRWCSWSRWWPDALFCQVECGLSDSGVPRFLKRWGTALGPRKSARAQIRCYTWEGNNDDRLCSHLFVQIGLRKRDAQVSGQLESVRYDEDKQEGCATHSAI